jgi:RNA polymerase sigma factor (sigma-70 family)
MSDEDLQIALDMASGAATQWYSRRHSNPGSFDLAWSLEDARQEARLRVMAKKDTYDPTKASVKTWAYTLGKGAAGDAARKHYGRVFPEQHAQLPPDLCAAPQNAYDDQDMIAAARTGILAHIRPGHRGAKSRAAIEAIFATGCSQTEAAVEAGMSDSSLSITLGRARRLYLQTLKGREAKACA